MISTFDVTVIGGGTAGVVAALQSARAGARTLLVEKNAICGGTMTAAGVDCPGLFDAWGKQIIRGIGWELIEKTLAVTGGQLPDAFMEPDTDWRHHLRLDGWAYAAIADEELLKAGVDIRFHTMLGSLKHDNDCWHLVLCGKDGLYEIQSRIAIDCTGDANATKMAGYGYNEPETLQPGTLSVYADGYDVNALDWDAIAIDFDRAIAAGELLPTDLGWNKTFTRTFLICHGSNANHICGINAADSAGKTSMEIEGRRAIMRAYRFLKRQAGLEKIQFHYKGIECGVRETRTIDGEHRITQEEFVSGTDFPDAVCYAFYWVDIHDAEKGLVQERLKPGVVAKVPLRALVPKNSTNFLAAGRIISSDRGANSGLRVEATCMATGQAAGAIAALASRHSCNPLEVPAEEWKKLLRENDAIVP